MAQRGDTLERMSYEITQEMIGPSNLLQRKCSFSANPAYSQHSDVSNNVARDLAGGLAFESSNKQQRHIQSSGTWTSLSREAWSDRDEVEDREVFIEEYNRLAKKHNVRLLSPEDYNTNSSSISDKSVSWFSRILRRTSSTHGTKLKTGRQLVHKRSISDITLRRASKTKSTLKDKSLQDLVRLCGLSLLYLPTEYAPCSLAVPTCFRATAQYLVQHGPGVPGVFRIPGSNNAVAALYTHYCTRDEENFVASTVRCPTLPNHINCDVHDVASAFKRFLSGLPGGILGSLALFDAFVSIQNQLHTDPGLPAKKQSQIRSKLIALAIATLRSQYRRELICAVFGLLSMIGHATENNYKSGQGEPPPPSDLMGYGPLGIIFGPLLIGDMVDNYNIRLPNPYGGLIFFPITPPKSRKEKQKERPKSTLSSYETLITTNMDKIKVVNSITEMLISHWQDVVDHLKTSQALRVVGRNRSFANDTLKRSFLRPSASEAFAPHIWDAEHNDPIKPIKPGLVDHATSEHNGIFSPRERRSKSQPIFGYRSSGMKSMNALSKTVEEGVSDVSTSPDPSNFPSHATRLPDICRPIKSLSTTTSDQDGTGKSALRRCKSGSKMRNYTGRNQDRVLRLPRRQSTRSLPDKCALQHGEIHSPSVNRPRERAPQCTENAIMYQNMVCDSGIGSSDLESHPRVPDQYSSMSNAPQTESMDTTRTNIDPLNKASPQEDLASLAELARVLLQESQDNETRMHDLLRLNIGLDKDSNSLGTTSRKSIARRKESCSSSSSSVQKFFPVRGMSVSKANESSGSSSSPLSIFLSRRRRGSNKQTSSNMAPAKPSESTPTGSKAQETCMRGSKPVVKTSERFPITGLSKTAVLQRGFESPIRASPRGTVKALVAKFSLGYSSLPTASPATKASVADVQVNQQSPKGSIVSPYTKNSPSPSRSQRSGISDNQAKEVRSPSKGNLHLNSSKKCSPFRTPVLKSSANTKSPSNLTPRSQEIILARTEESSSHYHYQSYQPGLSAALHLPVEVPEQANEAFSLQVDIPHRQATFRDSDSANESVNPKISLVSTRSNSVLHRQVQSLQQQLASKTDEIQQLRQQLEARSNSEMSTLAENLKEARREMKLWKSRAELFEKQVTMIRKTSNYTDSRQCEKQPSKSTSQSGQSNMNYSEDSRSIEGQKGKSLHGIDGAASWDRCSSEKSSRGRLHDFQSMSSTSENGNWLEQTMRALRTTES